MKGLDVAKKKKSVLLEYEFNPKAHGLCLQLKKKKRKRRSMIYIPCLLSTSDATR
jgi:hypothetical protein